MARHKGMPRAMRLEAMSKEGKGAKRGQKKDVLEKGAKVPAHPPKGVAVAALAPGFNKPRGKGRGSKNVPDSVLEAPHKKRAKAAKPKK